MSRLYHQIRTGNSPRTHTVRCNLAVFAIRNSEPVGRAFVTDPAPPDLRFLRGQYGTVAHLQDWQCCKGLKNQEQSRCWSPKWIMSIFGNESAIFVNRHAHSMDMSIPSWDLAKSICVPATGIVHTAHAIPSPRKTGEIVQVHIRLE
jgi:hypothetical protein